MYCIYKGQGLEQNVLLTTSFYYFHQFRVKENRKRKCEQYWPDEKDAEIMFHSSTQTVSVRKLEEKKIGQILCRSLCILTKSRTKVCIFLVKGLPHLSNRSDFPLPHVVLAIQNHTVPLYRMARPRRTRH